MNDDKDNDKFLLEIAQAPVKTFTKQIKKSESDAIRFLKTFNITEGSIAVTTLEFYYAYHQWKKHPRIGRHLFTAQLKEVFKVTKKGKYRYVYVSSFPFELINNKSKKGQDLFSRKTFRLRHAKKKAKKEKAASGTQSTSES